MNRTRSELKFLIDNFFETLYKYRQNPFDFASTPIFENGDAIV